MNLKKKVEILGLEIPVLAIVAAVVAPLVAGATLSYYGTVTTKADVSQAVIVNGGDELTSSYDVTGGATVTSINTLLTQTLVPVELDFVPSYSPDGEGITTTYQLVTTAFAKGDASSAWNSDGTAVNLTVNEVNTPAVVMVPVMGDVSSADLSDFSIEKTSDSSDFNGQFMVNLNPSNVSSRWSQVKRTGANEYSLFIYSSEGNFVDIKGGEGYPLGLTGLNGSEVETELTNRGTNPQILGVKAQLYAWRKDGTLGSSVTTTVKSITFDGTTYELNQNDRAEADVTGGFTTPPLPEEQFDFQITNEFGVDIQPDNYTITTEVQPVV